MVNPVFSDTPPPANDEIRLILLSGLSGGGKTVVLRALEDLGFYCVDNLPAGLLPDLVATVDAEDRSSAIRQIAVGIDVRNRNDELQRMPSILSALAARGVQLHLVFLDCRDEVLIKRFSETRRRHPLGVPGRSLAEAIAEERQRLKPLVALAERVIDSSDLNVHQLRRLVATSYAARRDGFTLMFESFAFKRGLPLDADFVFDARCLPNPHWQPALRPLSGRDSPVREYLDQEPMVQQYFADTSRWLDSWLPQFQKDDRSYLTVSIGCTGGRHRSVYLVEKLAAHYRAHYGNVVSFHREIE
ncbi:RNase adapter RapZ [Frateuria aurantia]|uniref:Putative P-loop-containing kinase n=1 Tax=Frateuria aurantia (strain ATCC 33424 / DSM 6220 / KCTC 2777 / LMG 1558 / NBRC 3245 / NCIMB 13370) TaxID=767434 RepID=H8L4Z1_FRAAD|nr:RNase adapter RapZ [Frateuria aurantia]AFC85705.1 putative P-loop-containing kinase [Frateuria aurantia DSM 6220]